MIKPLFLWAVPEEKGFLYTRLINVRLALYIRGFSVKIMSVYVRYG